MIRHFFTNFDLFGAFPTFRIRGQPETLNLCGGIASLLILLFFVYVFVINSIDILNFNRIKAKFIIEEYTRENQPLNFEFHIAIGIRNMTIEQALGLFEFVLYSH